MSKILDLLRSTIRREREWAETRVDHGDSTLIGQDDLATGLPAAPPDGSAPGDETIPGPRSPGSSGA